MKLQIRPQIVKLQKINSQQQNLLFLCQAQMKKATVLGLSANHKLIVALDDNQTFIETRFQGFSISLKDIKSRALFDELLGKHIEFSFNKNEKTIRYQNGSLLQNLIEKGVLTVIPKQLEENKLYMPEQKSLFTQIAKLDENFEVSNAPILLNDKECSSILQTLIKTQASIKARIEYLSEHILIRFLYEGKVAYLKCKLVNCKQYFQLFSQTVFWKSKLLPCQIDVKIVGQTYKVLEKQAEIHVNFPEETTQQMIKQGWISLDQKTYYKNSKDTFKKLISIENESIKLGKGIHSSKSQILSFIYAKNNYVGVVTNVFEGYVYEITASKTQQVSKIELPMVICPVGEDNGAFYCRQFARKNLIGKQVNVYLQKQEGLNTTGNIIRIQDWKDIESVLLQNGFAHVRDELKGSILGQKLSILENKARQSRKGLHKKDIGTRRFEDLCQPPFTKAHFQNYVNRRLQVLSRISQKQQVVIEQIYNVLDYKLRIQSMDLLINFRLQGVVKPSLNPNLKQYQQIKGETNSYLKRNLNQRTMVAFISDYDQESNHFIGTLKGERDKYEVQEMLIKASLVYADKYNVVNRYIILQDKVKKANKIIWQPQLKCFEPRFGLDKQKHSFEGRFSWVHNGKTAFVQPKDNFKTIENIQNKIREINLAKLHKDKQKIGAWCAAPYDGQLYRAVIKQRKDHVATVEFIDWGNQQVLNVDLLKQLPQELLYIEKQSIKVSLNLVAMTKNKEAIENVRQLLFDGGVYLFKKVDGDLVDFFKGNKRSSMNEELIIKGLLKADKRQIKQSANTKKLQAAQQDLRKQKLGIWQQSDSQVQQSQTY